MSECQVGSMPLTPAAIHEYPYFDFISGIQNKFVTVPVRSGRLSDSPLYITLFGVLL